MHTGNNTSIKESSPNQGMKRHTTSIQERTSEEQPIMMRRNPRLVIGGLEYFELLMEQEEQ